MKDPDKITNINNNNEYSNDIIVGYVFPKKKAIKMEYFTTGNFQPVYFVPIQAENFTNNINELYKKYNNKLHVILHKLSHDMVFADQGHYISKKNIKIIQDFCQNHPEILVLDPFNAVYELIDRANMSTILEKIINKHTSSIFSIPKYISIKSNQLNDKNLYELLKEKKFSFPIICKSIESCASKSSHLMHIICHPNDLETIEPPVLIQEYINHNSKLYKGYVIGNNVEVALRKSLPNLHMKETLPLNKQKNISNRIKSIKFDTQEKYPSEKDFYESEIVNEKNNITMDCGKYNILISEKQNNDTTNKHIIKKLKQIGNILSKELNINLLGFDVIIDSNNPESYYVIDVNYFPSYTEMKDFPERLRKFILFKMKCTINNIKT